MADVERVQTDTGLELHHVPKGGFLTPETPPMPASPPATVKFASENELFADDLWKGERDPILRDADGGIARMRPAGASSSLQIQLAAMTTAPAWTPSSWRSLEARHQPEWPDAGDVEAVRQELAALPPLVFAGEARADDCVGGGERRLGVPLAGGRLRGVVQGLLRPAIRERLKIFRRWRLSSPGRDAPDRQGRTDRRPVRRCRAVLARAGGRARPPVLPRTHRQRRSSDAGGADAGSRGDAARLPPVRSDAQLAARVHEGWVRRPGAGARLEPGVRARVTDEEGQRYERIAAEIERALRFMAACGRHLRPAGAARGRSVDEPRGVAARLRGGRRAATRRATGTTARRTCSGSASGRASPTAPTSSSSPSAQPARREALALSRAGGRSRSASS